MTEEIIDELDRYRLPRLAEYKGYFECLGKIKCIVLAFVPATNGIKAVIEVNGKLESVSIDRLTML